VVKETRAREEDPTRRKERNSKEDPTESESHHFKP